MPVVAKQRAAMDESNIDHQRGERTGLSEIIFAENKTTEQTLEIARSLYDRHGFALATRVDRETGGILCAELDDSRYDARARCFVAGKVPRTGRTIGVVCAGTSDLPVADEAAFVLEALGHDALRQTDVGVAGLHRVLANIDALQRCDAVIVVAGMEGALPSVVAGLIKPAVIAVPTSIGYGASFGGIAALLGMLTACAPGIAVVNIDSGFGAAAVAHKIALRVGFAGRQ
jgi:pyridinium-3,5-biscarboxylic acid mononucleotide synthase